MPVKYDLIVIGAGPGGYETAAGAAARGLRVMLAERDALGGTCLNRGCIPTKCLCAAAGKIIEIAGASDFGVEAMLEKADYGFARRRATAVMDELRGGVADMLKDVDVVYGEASVAAGRRVLVGDTVYEADKVIIATGSKPAPLKCAGGERAVDSDVFLALDTLPERLTIVGGGVIGLEFASVAAAFGTEVTVLEYCSEILPNFDPEIARRLRTYLGRRGIDIVVGAEVTEIKEDNTVVYSRKGKEKAVESDMVLCAVGRRPVVPAGCAEAGIELDRRGFIVTDDNMETTASGIYAIGDVNGRCLLAHAASAQGRVVLGMKPWLDLIPSVVFTIPECASVSLGTAGTLSAKLPYGANGKALASGMAEGIVKIEYQPESGAMTACHAIGAHASDLVAAALPAIKTGMDVRSMSEDVIYAHPTLSELLSQVCAQISS